MYNSFESITFAIYLYNMGTDDEWYGNQHGREHDEIQNGMMITWVQQMIINMGTDGEWYNNQHGYR